MPHHSPDKPQWYGHAGEPAWEALKQTQTIPNWRELESELPQLLSEYRIWQSQAQPGESITEFYQHYWRITGRQPEPKSWDALVTTLKAEQDLAIPSAGGIVERAFDTPPDKRTPEQQAVVDKYLGKETTSAEAYKSAQTRKLEAEIAEMPLKQQLSVLQAKIQAKTLERAEADAIWNRSVARAKATAEAPGQAAAAMKAMGGGFVPPEAKYLPGMEPGSLATRAYGTNPEEFRVKPQPFAPFLQAFNPPLMGDAELDAMVKGRLPELDALAQQASGQGGK